MVSIRAVYRDGQLRPLDPVDLQEGQEVQLQILDERQRVRDALSDLVTGDALAPHSGDNIDEDELQQFIDTHANGATLSDAILEERRHGR